MKDQSKLKSIIKSATPPKLYSFITVNRVTSDRDLNRFQVKLIEYVFNLN